MDCSFLISAVINGHDTFQYRTCKYFLVKNTTVNLTVLTSVVFSISYSLNVIPQYTVVIFYNGEAQKKRTSMTTNNKMDVCHE